MSVNADDLPAHIRRELGLPAKTRTKPKPSRAGMSDHEPTPGACACTKQFTTVAEWEAHAKRTGCREWKPDYEVKWFRW